jgi:hypothetical protein
MNDIELLQYGLDQGLHKREGWLWRRLVEEGVLEESKEGQRIRVFQAHQAQKIFIMAQKQIMPAGWDPIDPMRSVKMHKGTGQFQSLSKAATPVPGNVLTQSFLRFAFGIPKETFRRWMREGPEFAPRIPHNKGKSVFDDFEMAKTYFTPKKLFLEYEMGQFQLSDEGKNATRSEKKKHRAFLKEHFKQLPKDVLDVYDMKVRERLAYHGFIKEAIVDTLNDNNEQSFRQLDKVMLLLML